jgi:ABC-2 type transport system permease protein
MLTEARKHLRLIGLYFRFNLSAAMEYRSSFLIQTIGMALNNAFFLFFWWVIYQKVSDIGGYKFKDIMVIWALAASSYGFLHIFFGNVRRLSGIIINGELDAYLLQPKDVYVNVHCSRMAVSAWGDFLYGYILIFLVYGLDPLRLLLFTFFAAAGGLVAGAVMTSADTLTFFMGNSSSVTRLVTEFIINFSLYPDSIFKKQIKWLVYSLLPTGFVVFIPYRIMQVFSWHGLLGLIAFDIAYIFAAYAFFMKGLKRYESGNLITTRL